LDGSRARWLKIYANKSVDGKMLCILDSDAICEKKTKCVQGIFSRGFNLLRATFLEWGILPSVMWGYLKVSLMSVYLIFSCVWCPGEIKRIAPFFFFHGCRKRRLKDSKHSHRTWDDCDRAHLRLPSVASTIYLVT
jgi:hypothetical protein